MSDLAVDQAGNGNHPFSMDLTMMAVSLGDGLVAVQATNGLLNNDPPPGKGLIISHIFLRSRSAFGLATRGCRQPVRMEFVNADIGRITNGSNPLRQTIEQTGLLQQFDVSRVADHTVSHIRYLTALFINGDLAFERVLSFLAAVVFIGLFALFMALYAFVQRCQ